MKLTPTRLLAVAGLLTLISLALPWRQVADLDFDYTYMPSMCYTVDPWNNPTYVCDMPWTIADPNLQYIPQSGFETPARIYVAIAVGLAVAAFRSRSPKMAVLALAVGGVSLVLAGRIPSQAGSYAFVAVLALVTVAFQRAGLLNLSRTSRVPQPVG